MGAPPDQETRLRLVAAAKFLIDASIGNVVSVVEVVEHVRRMLDRALDAEADALEFPLRKDGTG